VLQLIENNSLYDEINWICNLSEELTCELTGIYIKKINAVLITLYRSPWFTPELGRMRQTLFLLSDNFKLHKNDLNKHLLHEFRNKYNLAIKRAKTLATSKFLKENSNPSSIWRVINQFRNTNNRNEITIQPDVFNNFFTNVAENIIKDIPTGSNTKFNMRCKTNFFFQKNQ
jgi:hypothetical protein